MSPLLPSWPPPPESTGHTPKGTKAPQQAINAGASHRVCGRSFVMMWFLKWRPDVPMRLRQSPAHVSSISFITGNDTQLNVGGYINEVAGIGFIARRAPVFWEACWYGVFTVSV
ncbi:hypothetical protein VZT92_000314 [Zoarces viviparus]|uniref:Uncharacterized protein n=1 Tax=Zoarces viviparus TaxID=48416 RepID=A0AAW1G5M1_ZOAVI